MYHSVESLTRVQPSSIRFDCVCTVRIKGVSTTTTGKISCVGYSVGAKLGTGADVGVDVGASLGPVLGATLGAALGASVGLRLGANEVGVVVGAKDVGSAVGARLGATVFTRPTTTPAANMPSIALWQLLAATCRF